ncbi:SRPBCC family protein [Halorhabdus rudnickae]|uniref:SRPBCC family protein n=1 Tax=Halorhabdus rudnickae TaxID=1775544 RepID=UPI0010825C41|nr:SRPBCC family protein [Halorhabdus rudnickae]
MIVLEDSIEISASPTDMFAFAANLDDNYLLMSDDHIHFESLTGDPVTEDSVFCQYEWFGDRLIGGKYRVKTVVPNRQLVYEVAFPRSILGGRLRFLIEPTETGIVLTERLELGRSIPAVSPVVEWFFTTILGSMMDSLREHQRDGLQNIKQALETDSFSR